MANICGTWYPTVFPDKCDGCVGLEKARCVEFCPNGVFTIQDGKAFVSYPFKCVSGCTACEPLCHKRAIVFPKLERAFDSETSSDKGLLRKATCPKCGKVFWTNREVDMCMDCEGNRQML